VANGKVNCVLSPEVCRNAHWGVLWTEYDAI